jgi:hypothetical protein
VLGDFLMPPRDSNSRCASGEQALLDEHFEYLIGNFDAIG